MYRTSKYVIPSIFSWEYENILMRIIISSQLKLQGFSPTLGARSSSTPVPSASFSGRPWRFHGSWDAICSSQRKTGAVCCALHRDQPLCLLHQTWPKQRRLDLLWQHGRQRRWVARFHLRTFVPCSTGSAVHCVQEKLTASTSQRSTPAPKLGPTWICLPLNWPVRCLETWRVWPNVSFAMPTCTCTRAPACVCIAESIEYSPWKRQPLPEQPVRKKL